jgi:hypothetical protein
VRTVVARRDPRLRAIVVRERPLYFTTAGRRVPVRAGSSLAWFGTRLAVVQDDAAQVALIDPASGAVEAVTLPEHAAAGRKLDLEACVSLATAAGDVLVMLSSGSWEPPWCIASLQDPARPRARLHAAGPWYEALHAATAFTGGALNIEGALAAGPGVRLFNRGGRGGANASVDVPAAVLAALMAGVAPPLAHADAGLLRYDLGALDGVELGFTDVTGAGADATFYVAAAEDSAGAALDGHVTGSAVGVIHGGGARWIEARRADGTPYATKVEGICMDRADPRRAWLVTDADDPAEPARLCEAELSGPWWPPAA